MPDDFAVFILTHGRPRKVLTYTQLRNRGYSGLIYLIVDDEDAALPEYRRQYGGQVVVFSKAAVAEREDQGDNFRDRRAVFYARNACFEIACRLGLTYFLQLDDDYAHFEYRINAQSRFPRGHRTVKRNMDQVILALLDYYRAIPAASIAMAQGGDFFGGESDFAKVMRKCMNSFFCSIERPFSFIGRVNEDVNTYTTLQRRGSLFLTIPFVMVYQVATQSRAGGMSEMYLEHGTYLKSFYSVMYAPSCVRVRVMGRTYRRLHHAVDWDSAAPCILSETYRKTLA